MSNANSCRETETTPDLIPEEDSNHSTGDKKSFTYGEDLVDKTADRESEVKVIWKKSEQLKSKQLNKPFFHPKLGESSEGEADKVNKLNKLMYDVE